MLRRLALVFLFALLGVGLAHAAARETLQLLDGSILEGEPISFTADGLVVKRDNLTFAPRVPWGKFTQSALQKLSRYPEALPHMEHLLEKGEDEEPIPKPAKVTLSPVPRMDRPDPKAGMGALFASPVSLAVLVLIYLANVYAGYEVARYRNYHPVMVCGLAAVLPVIGPIVFLSLPTYFEEVIEEVEEPEPEAPITIPTKGPMVKDVEDAAAPAAAPGAPAGPVVYRRPQTTFNRRFFETKLAPWMKVVPGEAERDLVLCVAAVRGNHVGTRIVRVTADLLTLLVKKGEASTEVDLPFSEITEVQIRPKDAAA